MGRIKLFVQRSYVMKAILTAFVVIISSLVTCPSFSAKALVQDGWPTPEQIAVFLPDDSFPESMTATMRYKLTTDSKWTTGHELYQILDDPKKPDDTAADWGFAWVITGLYQGSNYDVEVTTHDGGTDTVYTETMHTRSLPAAAPPVTTTISAGSTEAQIESIFSSTSPGDVIQLENGTYTTTGLSINVDGEAGNPIYIRGESRDGVIISDPSGTIFAINSSHIVVENMTLQGSGVDNGITPISKAFNHWSAGTPDVKTGERDITLRYITATGIDKVFNNDSHVNQVLIYECIFQGNNQWDQDYYPYSGSGAPGAGNGTNDVEENLFWNDTAIRFGGNGNATFNNTFSGFGDTFKCEGGNPGVNMHAYRNDIQMAGDDCFEADKGHRNITFYDNRCQNMQTLVSVDFIRSGPMIAFRNIAINIGRQVWKLNNRNKGYFLYNNTVVHTVPRVEGLDYSRAIWLQFNNGSQTYWGHQNNILIYQNAPIDSYTALIEPVLNTPIDFTHNSWYPDGRTKWSKSGGIFNSLAEAIVGLPATTPVFGDSTQRMENDIISELQPFETAIIIGSDYFTEVTTLYTPTLKATSVNKNSGTPIAGITDGYRGAAPDRGAVIDGLDLVTYGATD